MKLGLKTLLAALLAAALVVPAATAKPGSGHGQGHGGGKPSWAGQGNPHGKKPDRASKPEKAHKARKAKGGASAGEATPSDVEQADAPKHDNPAWTCKFERDIGAEAFAAQYGDEPNAFGKCVSAEADARDGVSEEVQPEETPVCEIAGETEATTESGSGIDSGEAPESGAAADEANPADAEECAASGGAGDVEEAEDADGEEGASEDPQSADLEAVLTALRLLF